MSFYFECVYALFVAYNYITLSFHKILNIPVYICVSVYPYVCRMDVGVCHGQCSTAVSRHQDLETLIKKII